jgi:hypothetical protein
MIGSKSHRLRPMSDHSHAGVRPYGNSYKRHIPTTSPHHNFVFFLTITIHCLPLWIKIDLAHSSHTQPFSSPRRHRERLYKPTLDDLDLESRTFKISPQTPTTRSEPPQGPSSDTALTASSSPAYFTWKSALLFIVAPLILTAIFTRPIPSSLRRFAPNFLQSTSVSTSTIDKPTMSASNIKFTPRKSEERGGANHGWLKTFHTFSFANYQEEAFEQYGPLRVINEGKLSLGRLCFLVE